MSNTVGFNTDNMRNWSFSVENLATDYDSFIRQLYSLIESFTNSKDFKGDVSTAMYTKFVNQKQLFINYSDTFRECSELIRNRAANADNAVDHLKGVINNQNPLG